MADVHYAQGSRKERVWEAGGCGAAGKAAAGDASAHPPPDRGAAPLVPLVVVGGTGGTDDTDRRTLLRTTLGTSALAAPSVRVVHAAGSDACGGGMVLAWHTNIAPRWLDPPQHDGGAAPDNFLSAVHEALIKNFREELYDHPALAERFEFAEDAKSASFRLRSGVKLHDGTPITPADKGTRARNSGKNG